MYQLEDRFFPEEGGIALSDSALRERLTSDFKTLRGDVKGAVGVKQGNNDTAMVLPESVIS